jgi:hypothetical protein
MGSADGAATKALSGNIVTTLPGDGEALTSIGPADGAATKALSGKIVTTLPGDGEALASMGSADVAFAGETRSSGLEGRLHQEVRDPASAVRALCRVTGSSSIAGMLGVLLPQQASSLNLKQMQAHAEQQVGCAASTNNFRE